MLGALGDGFVEEAIKEALLHTFERIKVALRIKSVVIHVRKRVTIDLIDLVTRPLKAVAMALLTAFLLLRPSVTIILCSSLGDCAAQAEV